jgi:nicotinamide phosphoribosyltransferase
MLHDFGYRGVGSNESSLLGGAAHLINFMGTDTVPALKFLHDNYKADYNEIGFSVPATEHSVMTSEGKEGEAKVVERLLDRYRTGILSLVGDSYDIYHFVRTIIKENANKILTRSPNAAGLCKVVIRPDSNTELHPEPGDQVVWIVRKLAAIFGSHKNSKGYNVLCPMVGVLWGDGIGPSGIKSILDKVEAAGFSTECLVFGMGGGLLQKVNRDTQRFAFKCSHQIRGNTDVMVKKNPLDQSKKSKYGMMTLERNGNVYNTRYGLNRQTIVENSFNDILKPVFYNGKILSDFRLDEIRYRLENE